MPGSPIRAWRRTGEGDTWQGGVLARHLLRANPRGTLILAPAQRLRRVALSKWRARTPTLPGIALLTRLGDGVECHQFLDQRRHLADRQHRRPVRWRPV